MKKINFENWDRASQYHFFKDYDYPFFNVTAEIEVSKLYNYCKKNNLSFFLASLFFSQKALIEIENFGYRIIKDDVFLLDNLKIGTTILHKNKTFGFVYLDFIQDLKTFCEKSQSLIDKKIAGQNIEEYNSLDIIRYSVLPWVSFKSVQNPRNRGVFDSIPLIIFGKYFEENEKLMMPISLEAHHALMDGYHVGQYFTNLEKLINNVEK